MLAESLSELGCRIVQANTDGLFVLLKKDKYQQVKQACTEWEQLTKLELEEERFEAMYQFAINDYIAIKEGYKETKDSKLIKKKVCLLLMSYSGKVLILRLYQKQLLSICRWNSSERYYNEL